MEILRLTNVIKQYNGIETALKDISFRVLAGDFAALAGPSGSGKTTILNLAAGLDSVTSGTVTLCSKELNKLNPGQISFLRRTSIGFVFQAYNLFPVLTAMENVMYPLALNHVPPTERKSRAAKALEEVGLKDLGHRLPNQMSGGQQQRVAIARAIVTQPQLIFADEPTANVDSKTAVLLLDLFHRLNVEKKITFLFSSHDPRVLEKADRIIRVQDGKVLDEEKRPKLVLPQSEALAA